MAISPATALLLILLTGSAAGEPPSPLASQYPREFPTEKWDLQNIRGLVMLDRAVRIKNDPGALVTYAPVLTVMCVGSRFSVETRMLDASRTPASATARLRIADLVIDALPRRTRVGDRDSLTLYAPFTLALAAALSTDKLSITYGGQTAREDLPHEYNARFLAGCAKGASGAKRPPAGSM
jgi:hypothetical protein